MIRDVIYVHAPAFSRKRCSKRPNLGWKVYNVYIILQFIGTLSLRHYLISVMFRTCTVHVWMHCTWYCLPSVQATSKQLWTVVNFLLTVIGAFVFGFCAANAVGFELPGVSTTLLLLLLLLLIVVW